MQEFGVLWISDVGPVQGFRFRVVFKTYLFFWGGGPYVFPGFPRRVILRTHTKLGGGSVR